VPCASSERTPLSKPYECDRGMATSTRSRGRIAIPCTMWAIPWASASSERQTPTGSPVLPEVSFTSAVPGGGTIAAVAASREILTAPASGSPASGSRWSREATPSREHSSSREASGRLPSIATTGTSRPSKAAKISGKAAQLPVARATGCRGGSGANSRRQDATRSATSAKVNRRPSARDHIAGSCARSRASRSKASRMGPMVVGVSPAAGLRRSSCPAGGRRKGRRRGRRARECTLSQPMDSMRSGPAGPAPTLPPGEPGAQRYDVVVIGGAFSGAATALLLRRLIPGCRVLVVERQERFGRKVGEATVETSGMFLTRVLGLYDHLVRTHLPKHGLRYWFSDRPGRRLEELSEVGPMKVSALPSFQLDRSKLDEHVLALARAEGAEVARPAKVTAVELGWPASRLTVEDAGGKREVTARWVIDASGRQTFLARRLGLVEKVERHPTGAAWARWRNVADLDSPAIQGPDAAQPRLPPSTPLAGWRPITSAVTAGGAG
jgi:hypothetical protein